MKTPKIITIALLVCVGIFSCEKDSTDTVGPNGEGCTDSLALNYNSSATIDDGSCEYDEGLLGCTNELSSNYDALATVDDGSCIYTVGMEAYGGIVAMTDVNGTSGLIVAASDYITGQTFNSPSSFGWTQANAISLCENLSLNGYSDWFVPTNEQLGMIYVYVHLQGYGNFSEGRYLTSETYVQDGQWGYTGSYYVDFTNGNNFWFYAESELAMLRPVRYFP